jgi:8-oxo-dGTP pyrophosphatase MutT (NUDIX family)
MAVTIATSRFPQYLREGFRPMMPFHEDVLAAATSAIATVDDRSVGSVVIARNFGAPVAAMISGKLSNPTEKPFWAFPKGHPDLGESDVAAAVREVREEVGIDVEAGLLGDVFTESAYTYAGRLHKDAWQRHAAYPDESKRPTCVFYKTVRCYLAVLDGAPPPLRPQEEEVAACEWVPLGEVASRFTRDDMREEYVPFLASERVQAAIATSPLA